MEIRESREYTVHMNDGQSNESMVVTIPPGSEEQQDEAAWGVAKECAEKWCKGGEWGDTGNVIPVSYWWEDDDYSTEDDQRETEVEIAPHHASLITQACGGRSTEQYDRCCGLSPDDHDWTGEGEGGCDENPGVWSSGGTTIIIAEHCSQCGLHRTETHFGAQRNPGQADTVEYCMPAEWEPEE